MKFVALLSGGKDSLHNAYLASQQGHELVAVANLRPPAGAASDELDSYMYQTVGHEALELIAEALEKPLFRAPITGTSLTKELAYEQPLEGDEVEQLHGLLLEMRDKHRLDFQAVSVGAIASEYQRARVANVCQRLGLQMLALMWQRDQEELLQEMLDAGVEAVLVKVACMGLGRQHAGQPLRQLQPLLRKLKADFQSNVCGEGGEYETLVLDCPLFRRRRLQLDSFRVVCHSQCQFSPVYYLSELRARLVDK